MWAFGFSVHVTHPARAPPLGDFNVFALKNTGFLNILMISKVVNSGLQIDHQEIIKNVHKTIGFLKQSHQNQVRGGTLAELPISVVKMVNSEVKPVNEQPGSQCSQSVSQSINQSINESGNQSIRV